MPSPGNHATRPAGGWTHEGTWAEALRILPKASATRKAAREREGKQAARMFLLIFMIERLGGCGLHRVKRRARAKGATKFSKIFFAWRPKPRQRMED